MSTEEAQDKSRGIPGGLQPRDLEQFAQLHGFRGFARLVSRRRMWIVIGVLLCLVLAGIITSFTKPVYEATATIELNKSSATNIGLPDVLSDQLSSDVDSLLIDQQTETAVLQGDSLALEVIQRLSLASQAPFEGDSKGSSGGRAEDSPAVRTRLLGIFKSGLRVAPIRGTRLIHVAYESHDPKQAAEIANAVVESYKNQYLQSHYNATSEASEWLTRQLAALKSEVEDSEKKLTDFERETGIISLNLTPSGAGSESVGGGQIHSVVIEKLDALNSELTTAEANRIEKEAIYHLAQSGNAQVILGLEKDPLAVESKSMVLAESGGVSNLQQLQQQENQLNIQIAQAAKIFGQNNRHLKEMQTQLSALEEQIRLEIKRITLRAQADFELAQQTENEIHRRFDQQQEAASKLNEKTVQFAVLSQEAYSRKKLYEDLFTKLQEANVSAGLKATNISVIDPARPQANPIRPKRSTNLAIGMILGLFLGFSAALVADGLDRTVSDPIEVEEITGRPVIGVIPSFEEKGRTYGARLTNEIRRLRESTNAPPDSESALKPVWMIQHPDSPAAEGYRVLRTSILLSRAGVNPKVILVTSCIPGEGKTTVTTNLGVAFAQHNKRVVIVEADMRRPKMKRKMDFPGEIGLSNVLAGSCSVGEAILRGLYVPTLDVLPAGPRPPMPSEILGSEAFNELLTNLRSRYDIVLIDSPPALVVTDAVSISAKVDAVLWVSQAAVVTRPYLSRASHIIIRNGIPVIGFVVNRLKRNLGRYDYGYEYETYGTYEEEESDGA